MYTLLLHIMQILDLGVQVTYHVSMATVLEPESVSPFKPKMDVCILL